VWRIGLMGHSARPENGRLCLWVFGSILAGTGSMAPDAGLEAAEERLAATAA
jgi:aspartate aminotransferase-like enzyme